MPTRPPHNRYDVAHKHLSRDLFTKSLKHTHIFEASLHRQLSHASSSIFCTRKYHASLQVPWASGSVMRRTCVQAHDVAESVLLSLQDALRSRCETAIEYFEALSTVPVAERAPFFAQPLCRRLLHALLRQACYPADFISWPECLDDDEDDFNRFR